MNNTEEYTLLVLVYLTHKKLASRRELIGLSFLSPSLKYVTLNTLTEKDLITKVIQKVKTGQRISNAYIRKDISYEITEEGTKCLAEKKNILLMSSKKTLKR